MPASGQRATLVSEFQRRGLLLPETFDVPEHMLWEMGYATETRRSLLTLCRTLDEAIAFVRRFIDPLLNGSATGTWVRELGEWR